MNEPYQTNSRIGDHPTTTLIRHHHLPPPAGCPRSLALGDRGSMNPVRASRERRPHPACRKVGSTSINNLAHQEQLDSPGELRLA